MASSNVGVGSDRPSRETSKVPDGRFQRLVRNLKHCTAPETSVCLQSI